MDKCEWCELQYFEGIQLAGDKLRTFLIAHGVINQLTRCAKCNQFLVLPKDKWEFRCCYKVSIAKKKAQVCGWRGSCRVGSFFAKSRLPVKVLWTFVIHYLNNDPPRQAFVKYNLRLPDPTIVAWYSFMREVYIHEAITTSTKIGGPGTIVEIDEAKFGKRKYNRGRKVKGNWVLGGVERNSTNCFVVPVKDRSRRTLVKHIRRWVLPGTTIITDCWKSYNRLSWYGFQHLTVNHSQNFVDPVTGAHTNTVERTWRTIRERIPKYGVRSEHFVGYLSEYLFKRKYSPNLRPHFFFKAAADLCPPKY